jgi:F0F1-type ATP synthase membrane subunit b/b'
MSGTAWGLVFVVVIAITFIVAIVIWQAMRTHHEATAASHDDAYRVIAEEATAAAKQNAEAQQRIAAELADLRNRIAAIEKLLSEVG